MSLVLIGKFCFKADSFIIVTSACVSTKSNNCWFAEGEDTKMKSERSFPMLKTLCSIEMGFGKFDRSVGFVVVGKIVVVPFARVTGPTRFPSRHGLCVRLVG